MPWLPEHGSTGERNKGLQFAPPAIMHSQSPKVCVGIAVNPCMLSGREWPYCKDSKKRKEPHAQQPAHHAAGIRLSRFADARLGH
ncbi:hypothetical protein PSAC2689_130139 [Paraburkholderia sacchari]